MVVTALPATSRDLGLARERALAVDMDHAGAAQAGAAAELGAGELELLADHPQQRGLRRGVDLRRLAVDLELHCHVILQFSRRISPIPAHACPRATAVGLARVLLQL